MKVNFLYGKCIKLIAFISIFCSIKSALAQGNNITFFEPPEQCSLKLKLLLPESISNTQVDYLTDETLGNPSWINFEDQEKVSTINPDEFYYADTKRYTITGDLPLTETQIKPLNALITAGVALSVAVVLHINQNVAWWEGKYRTFYVKDDWDNALFADKFGHFMGGYGTAYFAREALIFSGVSWNESILYGSIVGLFTQTYIEVKDGFAKNTGFSPSDFVSDLLGVGYFYSQHYIPFLQNFSPKWQYTPPGMIGVPPKSATNTFLDNYNSTTAWWSVNIHNLISDKNNFWPRWLNISFGYGINGYYTTTMTSRFLIGLDVNTVELLPDGPPFWNWFKQSLNLIKFPLPAMEFSSIGTKFYLLYPLEIP